MSLSNKDCEKLFYSLGGGQEFIEITLELRTVFQNYGTYDYNTSYTVVKNDLIKLNHCRMNLCWNFICAGCKSGELSVLKDLDIEIYTLCRSLTDYDSTIDIVGKKRLFKFIKEAMIIAETIN